MPKMPVGSVHITGGVANFIDNSNLTDRMVCVAMSCVGKKFSSDETVHKKFVFGSQTTFSVKNMWQNQNFLARHHRFVEVFC